VVEWESGFNPRRVVVERDHAGRTIGTSYGLFGLCDKWHPQYRGNTLAHVREGAGFLLICCLLAGNELDGLALFNSWDKESKRGMVYAQRVLSIYHRLGGIDNMTRVVYNSWYDMQDREMR
jgi:hypothetical protein